MSDKNILIKEIKRKIKASLTEYNFKEDGFHFRELDNNYIQNSSGLKEILVQYALKNKEIIKKIPLLNIFAFKIYIYMLNSHMKERTYFNIDDNMISRVKKLSSGVKE